MNEQKKNLSVDKQTNRRTDKNRGPNVDKGFGNWNGNLSDLLEYIIQIGSDSEM